MSRSLVPLHGIGREGQGVRIHVRVPAVEWFPLSRRAIADSKFRGAGSGQLEACFLQYLLTLSNAGPSSRLYIDKQLIIIIIIIIIYIYIYTHICIYIYIYIYIYTHTHNTRTSNTCIPSRKHTFMKLQILRAHAHRHLQTPQGPTALATQVHSAPRLAPLPTRG